MANYNFLVSVGGLLQAIELTPIGGIHITYKDRYVLYLIEYMPLVFTNEYLAIWVLQNHIQVCCKIGIGKSFRGS